MKNPKEEALVDCAPPKKPRVDLNLHKKHSVCLVLDYGSQYTQLIARRIRENGVYSMLLPGDVTLVRVKAFHCANLQATAIWRLHFSCHAPCEVA